MFDQLFNRIDAAVDAHPKLSRVAINGKLVTRTTPTSLIDEAKIEVTRTGCTARIRVKLRGSRKRAMDISGDGDTPEQAAAKLIDGLDIWAQAIE